MAWSAFLAWVAVSAGQASPEDLLREKLRSPFLTKAPWLTDYDRAREASRTSGKPILAYFTESFAPTPGCTEVERGVLESRDFSRLADRFILFCHITSRAPGEKYQSLFSEKGGRIWPGILFLDSDGNVLARHSGPYTIDAFEASGTKPREYFELRSRAEKGGAPAKIELALAGLELGLIRPGEAEDRIRQSGGSPSPEQKRKLDELVSNVEVEAILKAIKTDEARSQAARKCYERRKAGRAAPTVEPWRGTYWNLILEHAESVKDLEVFAETLGILKEKYSNVPTVQKYLLEKEAALRKLKGNP